MRKIAIYCGFVLASYSCFGQLNIQTQPNGKKYAPIQLNGSTPKKFDIVFIGDGFTLSQQNLFNAKVGEAVAGLANLEPYRSQLQSFNIWRVNVISKQSGISKPSEGIIINSALKCRFGNLNAGEAVRCIVSDAENLCFEAAKYAPEFDAIFVLVNDTSWGGCAGNLVISSIANGFEQIVTHELGHKVANLADEYTCYVCDGSDDNSTYVGQPPAQVNVTTETRRSNIGWAPWIQPSTLIPTVEDVPEGVIGLFEGAQYHAKGIYRSQFLCHMGDIFSPFCHVCSDYLSHVLAKY